MNIKQPWDDSTKKRLVEAAGQVFAEKGFRAGTVREICARAKASLNAVNYHFGDKEALYAAVFDYAHDLAVDAYPHELLQGEAESPEERLRVFIRALLMRALGGGFPAWHAKLMVKEIADPSQVFQRHFAKAVLPMHDYLESVVRELLIAKSQGQTVSDDTVRQCSMSVIGQCLFHHTQLFPHIGSNKPPSKEQLDSIADLIAGFSLGGIGSIAASLPSKTKKDRKRG